MKRDAGSKQLGYRSEACGAKANRLCYGTKDHGHAAEPYARCVGKVFTKKPAWLHACLEGVLPHTDAGWIISACAAPSYKQKACPRCSNFANTLWCMLS